MTLELPDRLAQEVAPFSRWLPTILEISLLNFETQVAAAAKEITTFLKTNPSVDEVLNLTPSERVQTRLELLLEKNSETRLSKVENKELDELEALEHAVIMLKASLYEPVEAKV